jgi:regulator of sigma E protease
MELLIEILTSAFWVILAITILVFVHELGHFLTAKAFGMRVERFSVGFPPKLFGRRFGDTEYMVGATPLGGYVKISGMIDESLDTEHEGEEPKPWEFRSKPVWQRIVVITAGVTFNMILAAFIFAGLNWNYGETYVPAQNVPGVYVEQGSVAHDIGLRTGDRILAVSGKELERFDNLTNSDMLLADSLTVTVERAGDTLTFAGPENILTKMSRANGQFGIAYRPSVIASVDKGSPAERAGLRGGDRIVAIGQDTVRFWAELSARVSDTDGQTTTIRWLRPDSLLRASEGSATGNTAPNASTTGSDSTTAASPSLLRRGPEGALFEAQITPEMSEDDRYVIGVFRPTQQILDAEFGLRERQYGPVEAVKVGMQDTWENTKNIVVSLQRIFIGRESLRENLGGPVRVAQVTQQAAEAGAPYFWRIVALLSITLAIMNILPVPALDGGQLVFLLYEGITRRKPSTRVRLVAQQIGMILLIGFMTFLIFNDILQL